MHDSEATNDTLPRVEAARESLLEEESHARLGLVAAFQERQCYRSNPEDLELTVRVIVIGSLFAVINGAVNMFFAFRYAGGLQQYWVIIVAYPVCKATELLPRGSWLNPGPFSPKEHCLVMTMAIAGSLAGTLGLSGGMLALNLYFDTRLSAAQIFAWAFVAGFFGLFFGSCMWEMLVLPDRYQWPFSKANAAFIAAFYRPEETPPRLQGLRPEGLQSESQRRGLRVFALFFGAAFCWYCVPNYFIPVLLTLPLLCVGGGWEPVLPFGRGGLGDLPAVLSSGVAGAGFPGFGGWATVWAFGPSIIPLATSVQIVLGAALTYWLFVPAAFFGGLAAWPSSFREFDDTGAYYNQTEGFHRRTGEPIHLSAIGMTMYVGVALSVVGMFTDTACSLLRGAISTAAAPPAPATGWRGTASLKRPIDLRLGAAVTLLLSAAAVCVIELVLPGEGGVPGLGMPTWGSCLSIAYAFAASVGCATVYASTGQNFTGGACIFAQLMCGVLVSGSARANIVAVMLVNTAVSQAVGVLADLKTALYLGVSPPAMFRAQLLGATIGVAASGATFLAILALSDAGKITLGTAEWPAIGAVSQTLNAKIFGEQGPAAVLHGPLLGLVAGCALFSVLGTLALYADRYPSTLERLQPCAMRLHPHARYSRAARGARSLLVEALRA